MFICILVFLQVLFCHSLGSGTIGLIYNDINQDYKFTAQSNRKRKRTVPTAAAGSSRTMVSQAIPSTTTATTTPGTTMATATLNTPITSSALSRISTNYTNYPAGRYILSYVYRETTF